ncbi:hypothetical protein [Nitrospira sp. Nam74]
MLDPIIDECRREAAETEVLCIRPPKTRHEVPFPVGVLQGGRRGRIYGSSRRPDENSPDGRDDRPLQ